MKPPRCVLAACLLMAQPLMAQATQYAQAPSDLMARFDADANGRVQQAEYEAYLMLGFRARDVDGNGVLEGAELPANAPRITRAQHAERLKRQFHRQDSNADGVLDARELLAPPRA